MIAICIVEKLCESFNSNEMFEGTDFRTLLDHVIAVCTRGTVHWAHPYFFNDSELRQLGTVVRTSLRCQSFFTHCMHFVDTQIMCMVLGS